MKQENSKKVKDIVEKTQMRNEALAILKDIGVFIPFDSRVHAYHGRVNTNGKTFVIKSDFDNSGNKTGFHNVNNTPGLHTSSYEIARKYAFSRTEQFNSIEKSDPERWKQLMEGGFIKGRPEVHRIIAAHPDLIIFDLCKTYNIEEVSDWMQELEPLVSQSEIDKFYEYQLSKEEKKRMEYAVSLLAKTVSVPELMPELFEETDLALKVLSDLQVICQKDEDKPFVTDDDLEEYISKSAEGNPKLEGLIRAIAGSVNVYQFLSERGDLPFMIRKHQSQFDFTDDCTLNLTCIKRFLESQNIVGAQQKIWTSNVINQNGFDEYFFFDTSKLKVEETDKIQPTEEKQHKNQNGRAF